MSNRLFVGNLAVHVTEDVLKQHVSQCGDVQSVELIQDRIGGRPRSFALVEMATSEGMHKAISDLNGKDFEGRALNVKVAEQRRGRAQRGSSGGGSRGGRDGWAAVATGDPQAGDSLAERASQIGEAWAHEYVRDLQAQARAPVGAWPGTMSEARRRVVTQLAIVLAPERLNELARVANFAAKRGWRELCEPELET
jgi:cold-inducible RNA-binding protein